jgi:hypothetical protein
MDKPESETGGGIRRLVATWEVTAGLFPGKDGVIPEYTRRWHLTEEWSEKPEEERLAEFHNKADVATAYARSLMNPGFVNHVKLEWLWV